MPHQHVFDFLFVVFLPNLVFLEHLLPRHFELLLLHLILCLLLFELLSESLNFLLALQLSLCDFLFVLLSFLFENLGLIHFLLLLHLFGRKRFQKG